MKLKLKAWKQEGTTGGLKMYDLSNLSLEEFGELEERLKKSYISEPTKFVISHVSGLSIDPKTKMIKINEIIMEEYL